MKTLYIMRHAKSSWEDLKIRDFDRPLLKKGIKRTIKVCEYLKQNKLDKIDYIVCSPAVRTKETAKILSIELKFPFEKIIFDDSLYFVDEDKYFQAVYAIPNDKNVALILGHNPMITSFVNKLIDNPIPNLPTSGLIIIDFETDKWENINIAKKHTRYVIFPKNIVTDEEE